MELLRQKMSYLQ